jgi:prolyl-tRNA synthetase
LAEHFSDDKGLVWPLAVAPAVVYLAPLSDHKEVVQAADNLYKKLQAENIEVLYDDREVRPGQKFADADLMGIPYRVVISQKTIQEGKVEFKARTSDQTSLLTASAVIDQLRSKL